MSHIYSYLGGWDSYGIPNYLDSIESFNSNIIEKILIKLPQTENNIGKDKKSGDSDPMENLLIKTSDPNFNGMDIYATFIFDGANYNNTFGYYVYPLRNGFDVPTKLLNGIYQPVKYSDRDSIEKIVVFPNTSMPKGYWTNIKPVSIDHVLKSGSKVRLLYDPSDPTKLFPKNTGVGFFVIPNGWNSATQSVIENSNALYTNRILNNNRRQTNLINDLNTNEMYVVFEDIVRPQGDQDFNNIIIKINYTSSYATDTTRIETLAIEQINTKNGINVDSTGIYYCLSNSVMDNIKKSVRPYYEIKHKQTFKTNGTYLKYKNFLYNFVYSNNCQVLFNDIDYEITFRMRNSKKTISNCIYMVEAEKNKNVKSFRNPDLSNYIDFQTEYIYSNNDSNFLGEYYAIATLDTMDTVVFDQGDIITQRYIGTPLIYDIIHPFISGDPIIQPINGLKYGMKNLNGYLRLFSDGETIINAFIDKVNLFVDTDLENTTYVNKIGIIVGESKMIINTLIPNTYYSIVNGTEVTINENQFDIFKFYTSDSLPLGYSNNIELYQNLFYGQKYTLQYVCFDTIQLDQVCIEILIIPDNPSTMNIIQMFYNIPVNQTATGAWVNQISARLISSLV